MAGSSRHKMSLLFYRSRLKSRYVLSIFVGLTLGFTLSLACLPLMSICDDSSLHTFELYFINRNFSLYNNLDPFRMLSRQARSIADVTLVDYGSKDYEPKINPIHQRPARTNHSHKNKVLVAQVRTSTAAKVVRPRYIADELGIREKVLVAVLTEANHLNTFGVFINQTLMDYVNRLLFFINDETQNIPKGMQVIGIRDRRTLLKPFYILKYLAEKMIKLYDWFLLVPDNTYIRGFKVS